MSIIMQNQNILKYIYYLESSNPLTEPDIQENLIESGIIVPAPFDSDILNENESRVFINPFEGNLRGISLSSISFLIEICIPIKHWTVPGQGKIRVFRIADEFSRKADQQRIAGVTETEVERFRIFKVADRYAGLTLWVNVNSSTGKGLRVD